MHPPTSRDVIGAVCADYDLEPAHLVGPARDAAAVEARDAAVLLLVELCGLQQTAATRRVGRMPDPTPLARARRRRERDAAFRERVGALSRALQGEAPARCPHCGGAL